MATKIISYLSTVNFNPNLWNSYQAKYVTQIRLVLLLIISIIAIGTFAYISIPRRLNPEIKIPIVIVTSILPGANPQDTESLLTIPIENKLTNLKGLDTMTSVSREGISSITLQFQSSIDAEKARADAQAAVDQVTGLPVDAKTPNVQALDFENQPIWEFSVISDTDTASLMRFSKTLKTKLEDGLKIDKVVTTGLD
jgi:multidrug efflux pump